MPLPKFTEITAVVIDESHPPPPVAPPEKFKIEPNETVTLPLPELPPMPADDPANNISATLVPIDQIPEGPARLSWSRDSTARAPIRAGPLSQPAYPPEMIRLGAQGSVEVELFVQPDGRVGDARIVKSSGYDAFDRNTLDEAKRSWRLMPATRDGVRDRRSGTACASCSSSRISNGVTAAPVREPAPFRTRRVWVQARERPASPARSQRARARDPRAGCSGGTGAARRTG